MKIGELFTKANVKQRKWNLYFRFRFLVPLAWSLRSWIFFNLVYYAESKFRDRKRTSFFFLQNLFKTWYSFTFNRREIQNLELFETYLTEKETYVIEGQNDSLRGITDSVKAYEIWVLQRR